MPTLPSLIALGSLAPWPTQDQLRELRMQLQRNILFEPITAATRDLASLWDCLADRDSSLGAVAGKDAAEKLAELVTSTGTVEDPSEKRKNIMTMPITTISQIVQYCAYLEDSDAAGDHGSVLESVAKGGGVQGFCAGLLSALAVASGRTKEEVVALAATSIKLAFCIGAYIDLDQVRNGGKSQDSTLAVRWKAPTTFEDIQRVLLNHPSVSCFNTILP
jgi:hypothetical protein